MDEIKIIGWSQPINLGTLDFTSDEMLAHNHADNLYHDKGKMAWPLWSQLSALNSSQPRLCPRGVVSGE